MSHLSKHDREQILSQFTKFIQNIANKHFQKLYNRTIQQIFFCKYYVKYIFLILLILQQQKKMLDEDLDPKKEQTLFNIQSGSIKDQNIDPNILSLRIMHSPNLRNMAGIEKFKQLIHLNLAQNSIEYMNGLPQTLQTINLQGNRIKTINCDGLKNLVNLNLSFNLIQKLSPLQVFQTQGYKLKVLDIRANSIQDLEEIKYLNISLDELYIYTEKRMNPVCQNNNHIKVLQKFPIKFVDKQPLKEFKFDATLPLTNISNRQKIEEEAEKRVEVIQLQQKVMDLSQQQKELIYKFECNEKYWSQKCSQLENEVYEQQKFNQQLNQENKNLRKEINSLKDSSEEQISQQKQLIQKKERKDEIINDLQTRLSEILQTNGQFTKENEILLEQIQQLKLQNQEKELKITDFKSQLKEAEKALQEFHKNAVDQVSQTLLRQEQLQQKYEAVNQENKQLFQENAQLKKRIQELLEICREWEQKYDAQIQEDENNLKNSVQSVINDYEQKLVDLQLRHEEEIKQFDQESRQMQDQLEFEVRNVLKENMDKLKQMKQLYDDKNHSEQELQSQLNVYKLKVSEQESIIQELQGALIRIKREVQDFIQDKDYSKKEYQLNYNQLQQQNSQLSDQIGVLQLKLNSLEREIQSKADQIKEQNEVIEFTKGKLKQAQHFESLVDELQTNITIKNKMLDDKNDTIDELKQQVLKAQDNQIVDDYNRLLKRYERQGQIIEELESQQQQLQDEYDQKIKELKDKKQLIGLFEKEIEEIKDKQDGEIAQLKAEIQDKDQTVLEMLKLLDEAKENIKQKEQSIKNLTQQYQNMDKQIKQIELQNDRQIQEKDRMIIQLRQNISQLQDELQLMSEDNQKLKRAVRDNLQNLNKLFT
ncbi:hypothetical protein pb186bvf_001571 [Paramecium bursaria]